MDLTFGNFDGPRKAPLADAFTERESSRPFNHTQTPRKLVPQCTVWLLKWTGQLTGQFNRDDSRSTLYPFRTAWADLAMYV